MTETKPDPESAGERARRLREIGDGTAVYGEVGQTDEQVDVHQPADDHDQA
jgi:hypothetical protein